MFFIKTLPMMDDGDDVAMVLSPQLFNNTDVHADIFNHSNIHFWEYMQIGTSTPSVCLSLPPLWSSDGKHTAGTFRM